MTFWLCCVQPSGSSPCHLFCPFIHTSVPHVTVSAAYICRCTMVATALASFTMVLDTPFLSQMWMYQVGGILALCLALMFGRFLLSWSQRRASHVADMGKGDTGGLQAEGTGASTPCHKPHMIGSPQCSPVLDVRMFLLSRDACTVYMIRGILGVPPETDWTRCRSIPSMAWFCRCLMARLCNFPRSPSVGALCSRKPSQAAIRL